MLQRLLASLGRVLGLDGGFLALEVRETAFTFDGLVGLLAHISLYFDFVLRFCVSTMIIRGGRFNSNFWLALLLLAGCVAGCQSPEKKKSKLEASFRVHLEVKDTRLEHAIAPIYRAQPVNIRVEKSPFLTELNVSDAKVTTSQGVLAMVIQLERKGAWILENYTSANPGRHYAIFSQWGDKQTNTRWLAGPVISYRITDGVLSFTPDATKEECEEIVAGLLNVAKEEGNLPKQTKPKKE